MGGKRAIVLVTLGLAAASPVVARAQMNQQKLQSEARLDAIFARSGAVEAGYGFTVPVGIYIRSGLVAGIGAGRHGADGRTDLISRFSLDPFRQSRWAPYAGAGLSGRYRTDRDGGSHAYLLVFLGVEGPLPLGATAGWVPAVEVGLGGGARVGVILRRGINARR
jgi:hypothetical protein